MFDAAIMAGLALMAADLVKAQPASEDTSTAERTEGADITVTGTRDKEEVRAGSRIPRKTDDRYKPIASDGIAGMGQGSGLDPFPIDGPPPKKVQVKECKSDNNRLSESAVCALAVARKHI